MLFPLVCPAQNYAWGKPGEQSTVAQLLKSADREVDTTQPYAELWVGTHVSGPAKVVNENGKEEQLLEDLLKADPSLQSLNDISEKEKGNLPYLFKILSVNKALSIQAHPDIPLAKQLHAEFPKIYKDDNHKPEMACAITEFEALAGFQSVETILGNISNTPELKLLLEEPMAELESSKLESREMLKTLFSALMKSNNEFVEEQAMNLKSRLQSVGEEITMPDKLALRLCNEYPGDVGVFCAYFMCYRCLKPGQAVFLGANEPHAYLKGDCAEVMARSDNVVRAGLTPKLRDVETLCSMLTYSEPHSHGFFPPGNVLSPFNRDEKTNVYAPPDPNVHEFELERTIVPKGESYIPKTSDYGCVILVLSGSAKAKCSDEDFEFRRGKTFFQAAGSQIEIEASATDDLMYFRTTTKGAISP
uniref:mannose-6-phosphate isomerase n=1 Tax=Aplanochytrium stocchinoi TaxID=215587 RepID=A0A7S3UXW2_9STRA|mmetsp:Transcript_4642/g.5364  ORF Transcript_4642/g.5364 Transcript_4642/m.5364 type:complete len:418 (+) Transcript_4642:198-1451(+)|eukprot:CAMPEP_0204878388 /NCGR_PEP_ID=MMETSP1348-20121228/48722_1 /ASSEMBLY_ACC=CAM_ASM_000700 /TAXON_ID=215587 /ORGANISM="Aplanochytrium stocchinoi, Strain GSBS06" /LENGTH=417 /DNA_ID=CAMNT_0052035371 /DNA_START=74 /DNA_END=1327 /DNA_ORIENTATION=-